MLPKKNLSKVKVYVLVSQGIEIYHTIYKDAAEKMMCESNKSWHEYVEKCIENNEPYADNEVFMYVEEREEKKYRCRLESWNVEESFYCNAPSRFVAEELFCSFLSEHYGANYVNLLRIIEEK